MDDSGSQFLSFLAVVSMLSILVSLIMLISLVQTAFSRDGILWGVIAAIFPPGTYIFCRKDWDVYRTRFIIIASLAIIGLVLLILVKFL